MLVLRTPLHPAPLALPLLTLVVLLSACGDSGEQPAPAPLEIDVVKVIQRDTLIREDFVGETLGSTDIPIRARVDGVLESRNFAEGKEVEQGQLLYTIDPRPFEAKVVEADGYLAEARTMLAKSRADLERIRPLAEMKAVSQKDLDAAEAQYQAAMGSLQAAEAQREQAKIQLGYTRIHAPIDGLIGITEAEVGEYVGAPPNPVVLNYVSLTDPIRVRFSINERDYLRFRREVARRAAAGISSENSESTVELILSDGTTHPHKGKVVAYDAAINPKTGTFRLEADFPNPDNIVISGQFARARITVDLRPGALLVPQRAISELQGTYRVFVVDADGMVELRSVKLGPQVGRMWLVESGLSAGELVAIDGLLRLGDGVQVQAQLVDVGQFADASDSAES